MAIHRSFNISCTKMTYTGTCMHGKSEGKVSNAYWFDISEYKDPIWLECRLVAIIGTTCTILGTLLPSWINFNNPSMDTPSKVWDEVTYPFASQTAAPKRKRVSGAWGRFSPPTQISNFHKKMTQREWLDMENFTNITQREWLNMAFFTNKKE